MSRASSHLPIEEYLPFGRVSEEKQDDITVSLSDYITTHSELDSSFVEMVMKTCISQIYKEYRSKTNLEINGITVDSNGVARLNMEESKNDIGLYDCIRNFINEQKNSMIRTYPEKAIYIEPYLLRASRYLWNMREVNDSRIIIQVITKAVEHYVIDGNEFPTSLSVGLIDKNGFLSTENYVDYAKYHLSILLSGITEIVQKDKEEMGESNVEREIDEVIDIYEEVQHYIKRQMITEFMDELLERIKVVVPDFPVEMINQFFVNNTNSLYHNVIYWGIDDTFVPNEWRISQYITHGSYGKIYESCKNLDCKYILKMSTGHRYNEEVTQNEIEITQNAHSIGVAPKIIATVVDEKYALIIEEKMHKTLSQFYTEPTEREYDVLMNYIIDLVKKLHSNGIVHCDLHFGNIMETKSFSTFRHKLISTGFPLKEIKIIDYGYAFTYPKTYNELNNIRTLIERRGIYEKLVEIGCDIDDDKKLFDILMFYDYMKLFREVMKYGRYPTTAIQRIMSYQAKLSSRTGCSGSPLF